MNRLRLPMLCLLGTWITATHHSALAEDETATPPGQEQLCDGAVDEPWLNGYCVKVDGFNYSRGCAFYRMPAVSSLSEAPFWLSGTLVEAKWPYPLGYYFDFYYSSGEQREQLESINERHGWCFDFGYNSQQAYEANIMSREMVEVGSFTDPWRLVVDEKCFPGGDAYHVRDQDSQTFFGNIYSTQRCYVRAGVTQIDVSKIGNRTGAAEGGYSRDGFTVRNGYMSKPVESPDGYIKIRDPQGAIVARTLNDGWGGDYTIVSSATNLVPQVGGTRPIRASEITTTLSNRVRVSMVDIAGEPGSWSRAGAEQFMNEVGWLPSSYPAPLGQVAFDAGNESVYEIGEGEKLYILAQVEYEGYRKAFKLEALDDFDNVIGTHVIKQHNMPYQLTYPINSTN